MHSAIFNNLACRVRHAGSILLGCLFLIACGPVEVKVQGAYPDPLVNPVDARVGIWFSEEFRNHEFFDEASAPGESDWVVKTGEAQVAMWTQVFEGFFRDAVFLTEKPAADAIPADLDAVIIPSVEELQYAIPTHTNVKIYEIWIKYRFQLLSQGASSVAAWQMSSYGKTPTAFLQSDEAAVNLAAVMALRDAGANFITNFSRLPAVQLWLNERVNRTENL